MLDEYLAVLLFLLVGTGIGVAVMLLGHLMSRRDPDPDKLAPLRMRIRGL